jgi:antitoxin HigA-1
LTVNRLATELFVPGTRVLDIVRGKCAIGADAALRLARNFGTTPQFWMNLQSNYDLELASDRQGSEISSHVRPRRAA